MLAELEAGRHPRAEQVVVHQHAGDAHHGGAAVHALDVELDGLRLLVVVAHPRVKGDVARLALGVLRLGGSFSIVKMRT